MEGGQVVMHGEHHSVDHFGVDHVAKPYSFACSNFNLTFY
jgi:hypothetical protein